MIISLEERQNYSHAKYVRVEILNGFEYPYVLLNKEFDLFFFYWITASDHIYFWHPSIKVQFSLSKIKVWK